MATIKKVKILDLLEYRLNKVFEYLENHLILTLIVLFIISLSIRFYMGELDAVLRKDSYPYLLKSLEIVKGNFTPLISHALGLPLFMSPFYYFFRSTSIFQNMVYAKIISIFVGSLIIFPLAYIGKKLLNKRTLIILLILFTFSSSMIISSNMVTPDVLFINLLLWSIYFIIKSKENINYILIASILSAIAYYVRINGILVLVLIVSSFFLMRKDIPKFRYSYLAYILIIFFMISAPFLYQRNSEFGSPFYYKEINKIFVDDSRMIESNNIPSVSLFDYLRTHNIMDYLDRFVIHGFLGIFYDYVFFLIPPVILFFFLYGAIKNLNNKKFIPFILVFFIWIVGLTPVWDILHEVRFLYPTIPIILIFSAIGLNDIFRNHTKKNILIVIFLVIFVIFSLKSSPAYLNVYEQNEMVDDGLDWGKWAASNIKGKIAIMDGGLIMVHLPDTVAGGVGIFDLYAPESNLSIVRPGYFEDLDSAMQWFREIGVTHLAIDKFVKSRPYLMEIDSLNPPPYLTEIYTNHDSNSKSKIRFYYINWSLYDSIK